MKGLVVFEGLDRVGKSTCVQGVYEHLLSQNKKVAVYKFPNRETEIGKLLDRQIRGSVEIEGHALHLLFSANRWETASEIEQKIEEDTRSC